MRLDNMEALIGRTPAVRFTTDETPDAAIWVKLEGYNPSGSVKDRACIYNIRDATAAGDLRPGMTLLDASSGNMACALAYYGRILGHSVEVVCNSKLTSDKAAFIRYFGGDLTVFGEFTVEGNLHCREVIYRQDPEKYCFLDQLHNWANPRAHEETTGPEILQDFPDLTAVVGSLGSGGTMLGVARHIKARRPQTKVITVEAASGTKIPGTGAFIEGDYVTPFIKEGRDQKLFDIQHAISLDAAMKRTRQLRDQGLFCGYQTGGVIEATIAMIREHGLSGDIVAISGDSGWKNMEKLLSI